jgi:phosphoribosyl 1,2-cyclic phosphate phosphodiesterase
VLIDGVLKVDFGPDTFSQIQRLGRDLTQIRTLFVTHEHADHFAIEELQYRAAGFVADTDLPLLHIYGSRLVMEKLQSRYPDAELIGCRYHAALQPGKLIKTEDGARVLPLAAEHSPDAVLLAIERGGRRILYGHDSGIYPAETIRGLSGSTLDLILFDCTHGPNPGIRNMHMGFEAVYAMVRALKGVGAIGDSTRLVATHFSHHGGLLYDELVEKLRPSGIDVAYDGQVYHV